MNANKTADTGKVNAPSPLRRIFPGLSDAEIAEMHRGFVVLFGMLYDEYRRKHANAPPKTERLDTNSGSATFNGT